MQTVIQEVNAGNIALLLDIRLKMESMHTSEEINRQIKKYPGAADRKAYFIQSGNMSSGFVEIKLTQNELPLGAPQSLSLSDFAHLVRIGVLPGFRRRGLAKLLLKRAEEYAQENSKKGIWLDYLQRKNAPKNLYLKNGYKEVAVFKDSRGEDRVIACKLL